MIYYFETDINSCFVPDFIALGQDFRYMLWLDHTKCTYGQLFTLLQPNIATPVVISIFHAGAQVCYTVSMDHPDGFTVDHSFNLSSNNPPRQVMISAHTY